MTEVPHLPWTASVLTIMPEMFPGLMGHSLAGSALKSGLWQLKTLDIRDFASDKHRSVDDTPAGGGPGMVMRADVVGRAVEGAIAQQPGVPVIALTPRGKPLTQSRVRELSLERGVILLCSRFEGLDERLFEHRFAGDTRIEQISIGDFVLSGGEPAAMVILDACVRLLPGVMGAHTSADQESFEGGLLEYPHYTRPREWEGRTIPEVLLSGNHARINAWRHEQAEIRTRLWRPDLWTQYQTSLGVNHKDLSPSGEQLGQEKDRTDEPDQDH